MSEILKLENVHKSYGKKEVLKGIDLSVQQGEIISVLGPSGCGKSTLLNCIAGILQIDEGTICIDGKEVSSKDKTTAIESRNINMVFQDFALWPHMSARDNILYGLKIRKVSKEEQEQKLNEVVSLLHLEGLLAQYPSELSGGQQQRVAIARALIVKSSIILLDEPLCNLDVQLRVEMRTEMAQLFHSLHTTVFHVTHDPSEAFAMADRIIVLNKGYIDQIDTPQNCYLHPKTSVVAGLLGAGNVLKKEREGCLLRFRAEDCHFSLQKKQDSISCSVIVSTFEGGQYRIKMQSEAGEQFTIVNDAALAQGTKGYVDVTAQRLYSYPLEEE